MLLGSYRDVMVMFFSFYWDVVGMLFGLCWVFYVDLM